MMRVIVAPPTIPGEALAELKQWLGITTARDDAPLTALLRAALDMCEQFTGTAPLVLTAEEPIAAATSWQVLATRPVMTITSVTRFARDGTRSPLPADAYAAELDSEGAGRVLLLAPELTERYAVQFGAGLATTWTALPEGLRHGVIRLAAHQHRERENAGASAVPPASVAALWRPYRRVRLT